MTIEICFTTFAGDGAPKLTSNTRQGEFDVLSFLFSALYRGNLEGFRACLAQDEFYFGQNISNAEALAADGDTVRVWGPDTFMDTYVRIKRSTLIEIFNDWEQFLDDGIELTRTYDDD